VASLMRLPLCFPSIGTLYQLRKRFDATQKRKICSLRGLERLILDCPARNNINAAVFYKPFRVPKSVISFYEFYLKFLVKISTDFEL
jgi:hypothetical protein